MKLGSKQHTWVSVPRRVPATEDPICLTYVVSQHIEFTTNYSRDRPCTAFQAVKQENSESPCHLAKRLFRAITEVINPEARNKSPANIEL